MREESDNIIPVRGERITREDARNRSSERPTASGERGDEGSILQQQIAASNEARGGVGFQSRKVAFDGTFYWQVTVSATTAMPDSARKVGEDFGSSTGGTNTNRYIYQGEYLNGQTKEEVRAYLTNPYPDGLFLKKSTIDYINKNGHK